jgi:hypothetical protein
MAIDDMNDPYSYKNMMEKERNSKWQKKTQADLQFLKKLMNTN